jgi:hypothetical protein
VQVFRLGKRFHSPPIGMQIFPFCDTHHYFDGKKSSCCCYGDSNTFEPIAPYRFPVLFSVMVLAMIILSSPGVTLLPKVPY